MLDYYSLAVYFVIYSFIGWCVEVVYHAAVQGKIVNRGFLSGPVCPIYGFGMDGMFVFLKNLQSDAAFSDHGILLLFFGGMVISTVIELIGGWLLDWLFHTRWWDYSNQKYNFQGYICPKFSLLWGIGTVLAVKVIHPLIGDVSLTLVPEPAGKWILLAVYLVYALDTLVTVLAVIGLNRRLEEIDRLRDDLRVVSDGLTIRLADSAISTQKHIEVVQQKAEKEREELKTDIETAVQNRARETMLKRQKAEERLEEMRQKISGNMSVERRLMRAFPSMRSTSHTELVEALKKYFAQNQR